MKPGTYAYQEISDVKALPLLFFSRSALRVFRIFFENVFHVFMTSSEKDEVLCRHDGRITQKKRRVIGRPESTMIKDYTNFFSHRSLFSKLAKALICIDMSEKF